MNIDRLDPILTDKNVKKDMGGHFVLPGDSVLFGDKFGLHFDKVLKNTPTGIKLWRHGLAYPKSIMKISTTTPLGIEYEDTLKNLQESYDSYISQKKIASDIKTGYVITSFKMKKDPRLTGLAMFIFQQEKKDFKKGIIEYFSKRDDAEFRFAYSDDSGDKIFWKFSNFGDVKKAKIFGNGLVRKLWMSGDWWHITGGECRKPMLTPEMLAYEKLGKKCGLMNCEFEYFINDAVISKYPQLENDMEGLKKLENLKNSKCEWLFTSFQKDSWKYSNACDFLMTNWECKKNKNGEDEYVLTVSNKFDEYSYNSLYSWRTPSFIIPRGIYGLLIQNTEKFYDTFYWNLESFSDNMREDIKTYYKYLIDVVTGKDPEKIE